MIDELERDGLIRRLPYDRKKVDEALRLARRDAATSRAILETDRDWAYTIAYNAVLQAGRALMFAKGYRPDGSNQHISVVKFAGIFLEENDAIVFDRMRRKRNSTVYDMAGFISENEAESAIGHAEDIVRKIQGLIGGPAGD
jgi:uncharacterized protein (UPF0332 family)